MKNTVLRESDGRIKGILDGYWFHDDDIHWRDQKIHSENVRFPNYKGNLNGDCVTYDISLLKTN